MAMENLRPCGLRTNRLTKQIEEHEGERFRSVVHKCMNPQTSMTSLLRTRGFASNSSKMCCCRCTGIA